MQQIAGRELAQAALDQIRVENVARLPVWMMVRIEGRLFVEVEYLKSAPDEVLNRIGADKAGTACDDNPFAGTIGRRPRGSEFQSGGPAADPPRLFSPPVHANFTRQILPSAMAC